MKRFLDSLESGHSLTEAQAKEACTLILSGSESNETVAKLLVLLNDKKETKDELLGFLGAIRETTPAFPKISGPLLDVCGTGGDGAQTFNVSTGVALVLAAMNIQIAKHGNRGVSSRSGSSDVLQALSIRSDETASEAMQSIARHHVSFLFAPAFYPVLAKIAPIRKSLARATLFNVLGPLLNPAPITHQLMGVYDPSLLLTAADVLKARGLVHAFVVHGSDRLDELTLAGETHIAELKNGEIKTFTVTPQDFGLSRATQGDVRGGSPEENAQILKAIFAGEKSARRDLVIMNAAAGVVLTGLDREFKSAARRVSEALDSGIVLRLLESLQTLNRSAS